MNNIPPIAPGANLLEAINDRLRRISQSIIQTQQPAAPVKPAPVAVGARFIFCLQSELAGVVALLGPADANKVLIMVTDYDHTMRWTGTALKFIDGGSGFCVFGRQPTGGGWVPLDGRTVTYLLEDGTLGSVKLDNLVASPSFLRLGGGNGALQPAVPPTLSATINLTGGTCTVSGIALTGSPGGLTGQPHLTGSPALTGNAFGPIQGSPNLSGNAVGPIQGSPAFSGPLPITGLATVSGTGSIAGTTGFSNANLDQMGIDPSSLELQSSGMTIEYASSGVNGPDYAAGPALSDITVNCGGEFNCEVQEYSIGVIVGIGSVNDPQHFHKTIIDGRETGTHTHAASAGQTLRFSNAPGTAQIPHDHPLVGTATVDLSNMRVDTSQLHVDTSNANMTAGSLAVAPGVPPLAVDAGTLHVTAGNLAVNAGTLAVDAGTLAVGLGTLSVTPTASGPVTVSGTFNGTVGPDGTPPAWFAGGWFRI